MTRRVPCASSNCPDLFTPRRKGQKYCTHPCAVWTLNDSKRRPVDLTRRQLNIARELLGELLMTDGLRVCLVPSDRDDRGKVRAVESANPKWFQDFCSQYQHSRRNRPKKQTRNHHTFIDRRLVVSALTLMVEKRLAPRAYGQRLEELIRRIDRRRSEKFVSFGADRPSTHAQWRGI
jgi:hypothetical protein